MPHATVASIHAPTVAEAVAAIAATAAMPERPTLAELRLDALWSDVPGTDEATDALLALSDAAAAAGLQLLATLRPTRQGGRFAGPEDVRLGLLAAAGRAGFSHLDAERDAAMVPGVLSVLRSSGAALVGSDHRFGPAPCKDDCLTPLAALADVRGAYEKFAFQASAYPELLRAIEAAVLHGKRSGRPSVSTMGYGGAPARALLGLVANHATYGHAPGGRPAVTGQPALADVQATWRHWGVTADDLCAGAPRPWLAALGLPTGHSLSPRLHNAWLREAGRPERMAALDVPASAGALRLTFHVAPRLGLQGASLLRPLKQDAARLVEGDADVHAALAANCVRFEGERSFGTNTDVAGVAALLAPAARGAQAIVLGSGAAARAAVVALQRAGADVRFASRDVEAARILQAHLGAPWLPWEARDAAQADIWVNATTVGAAAGDPSPLIASRVRRGAVVLEMNYGAGPTALEALAHRRGATVHGGLALLEAQGRAAYRFWTGADPPAASPLSPAGRTVPAERDPSGPAEGLLAA